MQRKARSGLSQLWTVLREKLLCRPWYLLWLYDCSYCWCLPMCLLVYPPTITYLCLLLCLQLHLPLYLLPCLLLLYLLIYPLAFLLLHLRLPPARVQSR